MTLLLTGLGRVAAALALAFLWAVAAPAQTAPVVTGNIVWGLWIDDDGCMHWWSDGGVEGYMLDRVDPKTGKPVCLVKNTCLVENSDTLFASGSAALSADARRRLSEFFAGAGAFGYAIYGHTDSQGSAQANQNLSQRRAEAVAAVARDTGAVVERVRGLGERQPVASNATAAGMRQNRRVEVICYSW